MKRFTSILAALALSAALVLPVGAATTGSSTDNFTIATSLDMSAVPASINYGAVTPGVDSAVQTINVTVTTNIPWEIRVGNADFTKQPSTVMPNSMAWRKIALTNKGTATLGSGITVGTYTAGDNANWNGLTRIAYDASGNGGGGATMAFGFKLNAPAGTGAGTYSGSISFAVAAY